MVTFRRVDLLLEKEELIDLHQELYKPEGNFSLFSEEGFWSLSPKEYMPIFTKSLPEANYATLIASTGGHWTTTLLHGLSDASKKDSGSGIENVLSFFDKAMQKWAKDVQTALDGDRKSGKNRRVVVRSYLPGHEDCRNVYEPWTYWHPYKWNWYNWAWIGDYNKIFEVGFSSTNLLHCFF